MNREVFPIDWSKVHNPTIEEFRQAMTDIEGMGPISKVGTGASDEDLTSEALYGDHP
jgi:hypothetical protein